MLALILCLLSVIEHRIFKVQIKKFHWRNHTEHPGNIIAKKKKLVHKEEGRRALMRLEDTVTNK
jgi:hypothetical protein